jgi:hypothetical protein
MDWMLAVFRFSNARAGRLAWLALVPWLTACSHGASAPRAARGPARHDAGAARDAGADPGESDDFVFDRGRVLQIELTIADADWDTLRGEGLSINEVFSGCNSGGFDYTLLPAQLRIDGVDLGMIAARKKGFIGSLSTLRPSLHLDLNAYDSGLAFHGRSALTLNNSRQDPSFTHLCMAFDVFAAAGVPASRCGFAHVTVNGRDLGVYVNVEAVKKPFLVRHFGDPNGNLYEGTSADFRSEMLAGFEKKQNTNDPDTSDLSALADALTQTGDTMAQAVDRLVDEAEYLRFWAVESLISHWDGYDGDLNNFLVYHDPSGGKLAFIPWGPDAAFVKHHGFLPDQGRPVSVLAWARLPGRLYAYQRTRDAYRAQLGSLLQSIWHEDALLAQVDAIERLLAGAAEADGLAAQRGFIMTRRAEIQAELDGPAPSWPFPERSGKQCTPDAISPISGSFKTTWGNLGNLAAGAGISLSVQIAGAGLEQRPLDLRPAFGPQARHDGSKARPLREANVVEVQRASDGHAILRDEYDLGRQPADRSRGRHDDELIERIDDGVARQKQNRSALVGLGERVPTDFTAVHPGPPTPRLPNRAGRRPTRTRRASREPQHKQPRHHLILAPPHEALASRVALVPAATACSPGPEIVGRHVGLHSCESDAKLAVSQDQPFPYPRRVVAKPSARAMGSPVRESQFLFVSAELQRDAVDRDVIP